ncbi:aa5be7d3-833c-4498-aa59-ab965d0417fc [Sclerotinia trifoliorum]|uniref:Aa5be7d3-833c-4498-aa59-ab965d0417fc n=1 Tax=Sclerotinia trifoliorum TaxID=28548 RepID=A0A8H2W3W3_9HELO|nr:aa5be7d3-833c-4498-aa59-ab965d0417fc [Sclerotinia trifoliorum]
MGLTTASVGAAVAPVAFQTFITHFFKRGPRKEKPTAHISYDEGLHLIRKFLIYASNHTVEDIQRFTSQWVPHPPFVKVDEVLISDQNLTEARTLLTLHFSNYGGIQRVGGKDWWAWRQPGSELKAEWIEMRVDHQERIKNGGESKRIMLYVHGGAYFFGSTDEHRYQMQRHARKLKARVFAPRYRLAPQFPFPCGLLDCIAAYLFLLEDHDPTSIVFAGDSAGGGMILSMLVILRDLKKPLPAGAILISPWVDLTHSFPSVAGDNPLDYIPPHGFHHRPSTAWPPPNSDDLLAIERGKNDLTGNKSDMTQSEVDAAQGLRVDKHPPPGTHNNTSAAGPSSDNDSGPQANTVPGFGGDLSIMIDGELVVIKDQIQMYATNQLISHPVVSPALQPSLGGLPPLLVLTGGGEMLRDEQIYVAHKAANPTQYPPGNVFLDSYAVREDPRAEVEAWKPTDVQLQVWDDLCHVPPTLSFTRPAKYMYRSIAQFGAWALAKAQQTEIEILDDDDVSVISRSSESGEDAQKQTPTEPKEQIGKAGDPLPPFKDHMIRQRVDRHGNIFPLAPASELAACNMSPDEIGVIKPGPVKKWMATKTTWDTKFAKDKRRVQVKRAKERERGYKKYGPSGEEPPPSALVGRRLAGVDVKEEKGGKAKKSWGMSMWSGWGSKHDKLTIDREAEAEKVGRNVETTTASAEHGAGARNLHDTETTSTEENTQLGNVKNETGASEPGGTRTGNGKERAVEENDEDTMAEYSAMQKKMRDEEHYLIAKKNAKVIDVDHSSALGSSSHEINEGGMQSNIPEIIKDSPLIGRDNNEGVERYGSNGEELRRPTAQGIAFPFAMRMGGEGVDGLMKGGVRERNARNGKVGRDANASTESLLSDRSGAPDGYEYQYNDEIEAYVLVKIGEDNEERNEGEKWEWKWTWTFECRR